MLYPLLRFGAPHCLAVYIVKQYLCATQGNFKDAQYTAKVTSVRARILLYTSRGSHSGPAMPRGNFLYQKLLRIFVWDLRAAAATTTKTCSVSHGT
uniref:Putative secreted protein n=1 Tax=Anopheles marajoara TaxID=58244 RepID=A0A2M4C9G8_9DIPT